MHFGIISKNVLAKPGFFHETCLDDLQFAFWFEIFLYQH